MPVPSYTTSGLVAGGPENVAELKAALDELKQILTGAVDADNLNAGAVGTSELADNAVTAAKLAAAAVTFDKLPAPHRFQITYPMQGLAHNTRAALGSGADGPDVNGGGSLSRSGSAIVCNRAGVYVVTGRIGWPFNGTGTQERITAYLDRRNAASAIMQEQEDTRTENGNAGAGSLTFQPLAMVCWCDVNDTLQLEAFQHTGGARNLYGSIEAVRLGPKT